MADCITNSEFVEETNALSKLSEIDYFTRSMNNNADNIMIVCPNHHGIIHDCNPIFDKDTKTYTYPNGYKEGLMINYHL